MTPQLRRRIISLQVVLILVFGIGAGLAFYASNFIHEQITAQLAPQKISFPPSVDKGLPENLSAYAGQQVVNGDQAHAFADNYLGLHLRELADGKVYSELSTAARAEKDPAAKAKLDGLVQTAFRGETLRSMLNQAWAFWTMGDIMLYGAIVLLIATLVVVGSLVYELFFASDRVTVPSRTTQIGAPSASNA